MEQPTTGINIRICFKFQVPVSFQWTFTKRVNPKNFSKKSTEVISEIRSRLKLGVYSVYSKTKRWVTWWLIFQKKIPTIFAFQKDSNTLKEPNKKDKENLSRKGPEPIRRVYVQTRYEPTSETSPWDVLRSREKDTSRKERSWHRIFKIKETRRTWFETNGWNKEVESIVRLETDPRKKKTTVDYWGASFDPSSILSRLNKMKRVPSNRTRRIYVIYF